LLSSQAFGLGPIPIDLALLVLLPLFLALHLVADQSARAGAEHGADRRSRSRSPHGAPDDASCSGPAERADSGAFFASAEWRGAATNSRQQYDCRKIAQFIFHKSSIFFRITNVVENFPNITKATSRLQVSFSEEAPPARRTRLDFAEGGSLKSNWRNLRGE
jgi:hypothetical protein